MTDRLALSLACMAGGLLGAAFVGGLWWTVRRAVSSEHPALWFSASLVFRLGVTSAGFYFASAGHWERLLWCLLGFTAGSVLVTRLTRVVDEGRSRSGKEAAHAPHSG